MKTKAIAVMLGIFRCGTAQGKWVQFSSYNGSPVYFDPDHIILRLDSKVVVWQKAVLNLQPRPKNYSYSAIKYIFDCKNEQFRAVSAFSYSTDDQLIGQERSSEIDHVGDVAPGTISWVLMNIVCKKK